MNSYLSPPKLRDPFNTPKDCKRKYGPVADPFNPIANAFEANLALARRSSTSSSLMSRSSRSISRTNSYSPDPDSPTLSPYQYSSRSKSRDASRSGSRPRYSSHSDLLSPELYPQSSRLSDRLPPPYSAQSDYFTPKRSKSRDSRRAAKVPSYYSAREFEGDSPTQYSRGRKSCYDYDDAVFSEDEDLDENYAPTSPRHRGRDRSHKNVDGRENIWDSFVDFVSFLCFLD